MRIIIETGHTIEELHKGSAWNNECWDFSLEDFWSGAIEPQEDMVYWLIGDRVYETNLNVQD